MLKSTLKILIIFEFNKNLKISESVILSLVFFVINRTGFEYYQLEYMNII